IARIRMGFMRRFLIALVLLLTSVCVRADSLLPQMEGNVWEYQSTEIVTGEAAPKRSVVTVRDSKQLFEGKEVFKFETVSNNAILKTELISVDDAGITCL